MCSDFQRAFRIWASNTSIETLGKKPISLHSICLPPQKKMEETVSRSWCPSPLPHFNWIQDSTTQILHLKWLKLETLIIVSAMIRVGVCWFQSRCFGIVLDFWACLPRLGLYNHILHQVKQKCSNWRLLKQLRKQFNTTIAESRYHSPRNIGSVRLNTCALFSFSKCTFTTCFGWRSKRGANIEMWSASRRKFSKRNFPKYVLQIGAQVGCPSCQKIQFFC